MNGWTDGHTEIRRYTRERMGDEKLAEGADAQKGEGTRRQGTESLKGGALKDLETGRKGEKWERHRDLENG